MSFWKWFSIKFHRHEWEIYKEHPLRIYGGNRLCDESKLQAKGLRYVLKCKICGEITFRDLL